MDGWIIYTYGNLQILQSVLMSIAAFFGGNMIYSFVSLAAITAIVMFLFNAVGLTVKGNQNAPMDYTFFIRFYLIYAFFVLTPAGKITIQDQMTNQTAVIDVSNGRVPLGIALINSYTSVLFNGLIQAYQSFFISGSSGDVALSYSKSGMAFGSNFINSAPTFTSGDYVFDNNLRNYYENCGFPIANNSGAIDAMTMSGDLLTFFSTNFQNQQRSRFVQQFNPTTNKNEVADCWTAIQNINNRWAQKQTDVLTSLARKLGFADDQYVYQNFIAAGDLTAKQMMGITGGMAQATKQAIAMNVAYKAITSNALQVGNTGLANAAYDAQQFQQYKAGGDLSGEMAGRIVPAIKIFFETMAYLVYPFIIFYALLSMSFFTIGKYLQVIATINAIPFVYEVINTCMNYYATSKATGVISDGGYTLMNASNLYSLNSTIVSASNYLAASAPVLAYMLVSGATYAVTSVMGHSSDPAKSAATSTGNEMSKGNTNIGNTQMDNANYGNTVAGNYTGNSLSSGNTNMNNDSMDNVSRHQHNTAPTNRFGAGVSTEILASGTAVTRVSDGGVYMDQNKSNLAIDASIQNAAQKQLQHSYSDAASNETRAQQQLSNAVNDGLDFVKKHGTSEQQLQAAALQTNLQAGWSLRGNLNSEKSFVGGALKMITGASMSAGVNAGGGINSSSATQSKLSASNTEEANAKLSALNQTTSAYNTAHARTQQLQTLVGDSTSSSSSISPNAANMLVTAAMNANNGDSTKADAWLKDYNNVKNVIDDVAAGGNKYGENIYSYSPTNTATAQGAAGSELNQQLSSTTASNSFGATGSSNDNNKMETAQKSVDANWNKAQPNTTLDPTKGAFENAASATNQTINKFIPTPPENIIVPSYTSPNSSGENISVAKANSQRPTTPSNEW